LLAYTYTYTYTYTCTYTYTYTYKLQGLNFRNSLAGSVFTQRYSVVRIGK